MCYRSTPMSASPGVPAVILAAGVGRRLLAAAGRPKALLELNGRTLLERALDALAQADFRRVVLVTGHHPEAIREYLRSRPTPMEIVERWNPEFATSNNIVSLLAAEDMLSRGFCLLNSDIIFPPSIVSDTASRATGNWMVVDGDEPLGSEEMKVMLDRAGHISRVNKNLDSAASVGEYIGILRLDAAGAETVFSTARRLVAEGGAGLYYEDAIDQCAADLEAQPIWTAGRAWTEIDDEADHQRARRIALVLDGAVAS